MLWQRSTRVIDPRILDLKKSSEVGLSKIIARNVCQKMETLLTGTFVLRV